MNLSQSSKSQDTWVIVIIDEQKPEQSQRIIGPFADINQADAYSELLEANFGLEVKLALHYTKEEEQNIEAPDPELLKKANNLAALFKIKKDCWPRIAPSDAGYAISFVSSEGTLREYRVSVDGDFMRLPNRTLPAASHLLQSASAAEALRSLAHMSTAALTKIIELSQNFESSQKISGIEL